MTSADPHQPALPDPAFNDEKLGGDDKRDVIENKDIAALSYLWVLSVIIYFLKRKSPFVRFHAKQGIVLFLISLVFLVVPIVGQFLELIVLAGVVMGFVNAAQGQKHDVPVVGPLSRGEITVRQAWKQVIESVVRLSKAFREGMKSGNASTPPDSTKKPTP